MTDFRGANMIESELHDRFAAKDTELAALRERVKELEEERDKWDRRIAYDELKAREYENRATQQGQIDALTVRAETAERKLAEAREALKRLAGAKALSGVRKLVAGWNGEDQPQPHKERHPDKLGATLPKTTCGAIYELDEALTAARAITGED